MKKLLLLPLTFVCILSITHAQTFNFTNSLATGQNGPTQSQVTTEYAATSLAGMVTITTQGIQEWVVPATGTYQITAVGACGGELQGTYYPGLPGTGASMQGEFSLIGGTTIYIIVGQKGTYADNGSGGGGGSFVYTGTPGGAGLMIVAGGGGGHGHGTAGTPNGANGGGGGITASQVNGVGGTGNGGSPGAGFGGNAGGGGCSFSGVGAGGAGWTSNGGTPVACGTATGGSYSNFIGGFGGGDGLHGGFGGGGGADGNGSPGGGGGGYTGGGGGNDWNSSAWGAGAGAGSFNIGTLQVNTPGVTGAASGFSHGAVSIVFTCAPTSIAPDVTILTDITAECSVTPTPPTATNDCGVSIPGTPDVSFPITAQGTTLITWTYDDGFNIITQTQIVIITDVTSPVADSLSLPDLTGVCQVDAPISPTATDNCIGNIVGTPDITFPVMSQGTTIVTWTYDDGNGNITTQTQNVIISDSIAPVEDVGILVNVVGCISVTLTAPTATDNCVGVITGVPDVTFPITSQGSTIVMWTYADGNGNLTTQTQNVIVIVVDVNVSQVGGTLTATTSIASYQWLDCDNSYAMIAGETNQSYTPTAMVGNYAVEVTENGCVDTSACFVVDYTGVDMLNSFGISLFPNPNHGTFYVESKDHKIRSIEVMDNSGKLVYNQFEFFMEKVEINLTQFDKGVYFIKLSGDFGTIVRPVVLY